MIKRRTHSLGTKVKIARSLRENNALGLNAWQHSRFDRSPFFAPCMPQDQIRGYAVRRYRFKETTINRMWKQMLKNGWLLNDLMVGWLRTPDCSRLCYREPFTYTTIVFWKSRTRLT